MLWLASAFEENAVAFTTRRFPVRYSFGRNWLPKRLEHQTQANRLSALSTNYAQMSYRLFHPNSVPPATETIANGH